MRASTRLCVVRLAFAALTVFAACDRRTAPWVDPGDEPPRLERPLRIPGLETPQPQADAPRDSLAATGAPIRGRVVLAPGASAPASAALFVIARHDAGSAGPPLAAARLDAAAFPVEFELGPDNVMLPGQPWTGPLFLSARLDPDGNAMTREPGGLSASLGAPIDPGAAGVELVLAAESQAPAAAAESIRGVIRLAPGLTASADSVVFLIARGPGGGPPIAAKRLPPGPFPLEFDLGPADVMMGGSRSLGGPVLLSARLDSDGDASSKTPDEPHAELPIPIQPGATGIEITLTR